MPALNAGSPAVPAANPSTGTFVIMSPFNGPKGSPLDAKSLPGGAGSVYGAQNVPVLIADPTNYSTGAINTGIGFDAAVVIGLTAPQSIKDAGFSDDYTPGISTRTISPALQNATTSTLVAIGGGRSNIVAGTGPNGNGSPASERVSATVPYTAGFQLLGFGNGGNRDAGAGPAFTGFGIKMVTAVASVAVGAAIEAGFLNRGIRTLVTGESSLGSAVAASPAVA